MAGETRSKTRRASASGGVASRAGADAGGLGSAGPLIGHGALLERLWSIAADDRLAHAILFRGPRGIGKFRALQEFAAGLFCEQGPGAPCGGCPPCKRLRSGNHADYFVVDAQADGEQLIKIDRIAERENSDFDGTPIEVFLRLKPLEGGRRIVVIRDAHRMNEAAQNAFLKTLEEPRPGTLLLLESSEPERLLPTILSRVVGVEVAPLATADVRAVLEREGVEAAELDALTRWANGSPGRALEDRRRALPLMRAVLAQRLRGELTADEAVAALLDAKASFPGKTPTAQVRARVRAICELGLDVLGDLVRAQVGVPPEQLVHGDLAAPVHPLIADRLRACLDVWLEVRGDIELNLNADSLLLRALGPLRLPLPATR